MATRDRWKRPVQPVFCHLQYKVSSSYWNRNKWDRDSLSLTPLFERLDSSLKLYPESYIAHHSLLPSWCKTLSYPTCITATTPYRVSVLPRTCRARIIHLENYSRVFLYYPVFWPECGRYYDPAQSTVTRSPIDLLLVIPLRQHWPLLPILWIQQACSCLRTFALVPSSAPNVLSSVILLIYTLTSLGLHSNTLFSGRLSLTI